MEPVSLQFASELERIWREFDGGISVARSIAWGMKGNEIAPETWASALEFLCNQLANPLEQLKSIVSARKDG